VLLAARVAGFSPSHSRAIIGWPQSIAPIGLAVLFDKLAYKIYNVYKLYKPCEWEEPLEQTIGATELRQRLTDVLQAVREEQATYIIATFDRSQAALVNLEEYRQFQRFKQEREAFFDWLDETASRNAAQNLDLGDNEVLAIIEQARTEAAAELE
jgi:PHD/YefM family antitoxin component YafN of YafNO toxin-antitoxin module